MSAVPRHKQHLRDSSSARTARAPHQAAPIAVMLLAMAAGRGRFSCILLCAAFRKAKVWGARVGYAVPLGKKEEGSGQSNGCQCAGTGRGWRAAAAGPSCILFPLPFHALWPGSHPTPAPLRSAPAILSSTSPAPAMHFPSPFDISPSLRHPPACRVGARFHVDVLFLTTATGSCRGCLSHHHEPIVSVLLGLMSGGPNRSTGMAKRQPGLPPLAPSRIRCSLGCSLAGFSFANKRN